MSAAKRKSDPDPALYTAAREELSPIACDRRRRHCWVRDGKRAYDYSHSCCFGCKGRPLLYGRFTQRVD